MSVVPYTLLRERGLGVRHVHATGNDVDVTAGEVVHAVLSDPEVRLVLLYLEDLSAPGPLLAAATRARERGVPVVVLKAGRSEGGRRAAASHTGAIATEDRVVDAFIERLGFWRVTGTRDFVNAAEIYLNAGRPQGRRIAIISNSGATCVLAADAAARNGLELAPLAEATQDAVKQALPAFAATANPVDLTGALLQDNAMFGRVLPIMGADPSVDMFLIAIPICGRGYDVERFASDTKEFAERTGKPVALAVPQPGIRAVFARTGLPTFITEDEAIEALAQRIGHEERLQKAAELPSPPVAPVGEGLSTMSLDEAASMARLEAVGAPCPDRLLCRRVEDAIAFRDSAGEPIVLKACSAGIPHKSDHGLVAVGVDDPAEVAAAFARIETEGRALDPDLSGVLAVRMVRGRRELVAGGYRDPVFGPVLMLGDGGILVEAVPDNGLILPPMSRDTARDALERLRIAPLFAGVRGQPPLDFESVFATLQAVARLLEDPGVVSVDINPLIVGATGAVAADALVEVIDRG